MKEIDARGLECPKPVILTKKELDSIKEGKVRTTVDNEVARENLIKLAKSQNADFEVEELEGGLFAVTIEKKASIETENHKKMVEVDENFVIAIQSEHMGRGDEKLGEILMKSFIYTVKETKPYPKTMLFFNSGVKLTVAESEVLDDLKALENEGVEIISCGTCLDYFNLKDKLEVGSISNMYTIYEKLRNSTNVVTIG
ncbi:MAG TPA: sulfurtransferase-like selenium metabolism protein YedF [Soehngenia sp.]|nr:sulfurtransferase-like selenium metabolism protein YedF [Soehngenia sp.]HPP31569.1 sulfurtransferase-like selenium metabolism protein YedF [Soehngenia sp.]